MCEVSRLTGIEGLDVTKAFTPPSLPEGAFFLFNMNNTKKRAAKRAALKNTTVTRRPNARKPRFFWPSPLTPLFKIQNLKAYREYYGCNLGEAMRAITDAMERATDRANGNIPF